MSFNQTQIHGLTESGIAWILEALLRPNPDTKLAKDAAELFINNYRKAKFAAAKIDSSYNVD
jgi:hypothetical protein